MSTLKTLVNTAEKAQVDRIILTIQPRGDGEANATIHFAVDQRASMGLDKETHSLRLALGKAIMASGNVEELETSIADSLRRIEAALGLGVEKYRAQNTADDVVKGLMVASVSTPETDATDTTQAPVIDGNAEVSTDESSAKAEESTEFANVNLDL